MASNSNLATNPSSSNSNTVKSDYIILEYGWKKLSPNMRKIYERYFAAKTDFQYEMTKG